MTTPHGAPNGPYQLSDDQNRVWKAGWQVGFAQGRSDVEMALRMHDVQFERANRNQAELQRVTTALTEAETDVSNLLGLNGALLAQARRVRELVQYLHEDIAYTDCGHAGAHLDVDVYAALERLVGATVRALDEEAQQ